MSRQKRAAMKGAKDVGTREAMVTMRRKTTTGRGRAVGSVEQRRNEATVAIVALEVSDTREGKEEERGAGEATRGVEERKEASEQSDAA